MSHKLARLLFLFPLAYNPGYHLATRMVPALVGLESGGLVATDTVVALALRLCGTA